MYKEPVNEVNTLLSNLKNLPALSEARITIYLKDDEADSKSIKQDTGADRVMEEIGKARIIRSLKGPSASVPSPVSLKICMYGTCVVF